MPRKTKLISTAGTQQDVFDEAIAQRQAEQDTEKQEHKRRVDPHPYQQFRLGEGADAPRMRLWRNEKKKEFAITFDEKPDAKYLEMLRDGEFTWRGADKAWVMPMDQDEKWKTTLQAERVFNEAGRAIQKELGLDGQAVG